MLVLAVVCLAIGIGAPYIIANKYSTVILAFLDVDNLGNVGDFFAGTTTPFFTMAAFFMILEGYFLQKKSSLQLEKK